MKIVELTSLRIVPVPLVSLPELAKQVELEVLQVRLKWSALRGARVQSCFRDTECKPMYACDAASPALEQVLSKSYLVACVAA